MASDALENYLAQIGGQIIEGLDNLLYSAKVYRSISQPCTNCLAQSGWILQRSSSKKDNKRVCCGQ